MEMNPYFFKMVENPIFYLLQDDSVGISTKTRSTTLEYPPLVSSNIKLAGKSTMAQEFPRLSLTVHDTGGYATITP